MRKQFIDCADRRTALRRCPWACATLKALNGFWAFESAADYYIWKNRK